MLLLKANDEEWKPAPSKISIGRKDIHLWKCTFKADRDEIRRLECILAPEELARAGRFVHAVDRDRFTYFHGVLRNILCIYTKMAASLLVFDKNEFGKPEMRHGVNSCSVNFSLSHSQDVALVGVSLNRQIGVDVEACRAIEEAMDIVKNYFSEAERNILLSLDNDEFTEAFLICWTRKEAFVKATGKGLSTPLHQITVPLHLSRVCITNSYLPEPSCNLPNWQFKSFCPHESYVGALVAEPFSSLSLYKFN